MNLGWTLMIVVYILLPCGLKKQFIPKKLGSASKPYLNHVYVEAFNIYTFNQEYDESAILKTKSYNPHSFIFQHLPVKKKFRKKHRG